MEKLFTENTMNDVMIHDMNYDMKLCHEGINTPFICHDSKNRITKDEWFYLVDTLTQWRVFNPRAVIKKNPAAAWKCMNLCKENKVRVPGAYFTACFRKELAKAELEAKLGIA